MKYSSQSTIIAKVGDASEFIPSVGRLGRLGLYFAISSISSGAPASLTRASASMK